MVVGPQSYFARVFRQRYAASPRDVLESSARRHRQPIAV